MVDILVAEDSLAHLRQIVEARLRWACVFPSPLPAVYDDTLRQLLAKFGDDIRSI
jgi:hypothetical protein